MKKKVLSGAISAVVLGATVVPIVLTVSCGTNATPERKDIFKPITEGGKASEVVGNTNYLQGTLENPASVTPDSRFGMYRNSDATTGENEPAEKNERVRSGTPFAPGLDPEVLWNWIPVEQKATEAAKPVSDASFGGRFDYPQGGPDIQRMFQEPDGEFNRSFVPLKERTHGEKLKPTQSAFAKFTLMRGQKDKNGLNRLGFGAGIKNAIEERDTYSWQYLDSVASFNPGPINSLKAPSAEEINISHRNGVPSLATLLLYARATGESEHDLGVITQAGPNGDYPIAKGMVEYALYHGFDGYAFDWETGTAGVEPFIKALLSYAKTGQYTTTSGNVVSIKDDTTDAAVKAARQKFGYGWKELMISHYSFGAQDIANNYGDLQYQQQMHARDASAFQMGQYMKSLPDMFFGNGASNWPEDALSGTYDIFNKYYKASADQTKYLRTDLFPGTTKAENMFSNWFWEYGAAGVNEDAELFSSYAGDPRVIDEDSHWAISNSFQERTTIIGHENWATVFGTGNGLNYSMFGSPDFKKSMQGASDSGWRDISMQSQLPTYKYIIDTFDGQNKQTNDITKLSGGKVVRSVNASINNMDNAWMGGSTLSYSGSLPIDNYFVNKLYASNVKLEDKDQFTIKIKNNWGDAYQTDAIIPELALWTDNSATKDKDFNFDSDYYKSDGSEAFDWAQGSTHDQHSEGVKGKFGFKTDHGKYDLYKAMKYEKESSWKSQERTLKTVAPKSVSKVGDSEWLELKYDLSQFKGQRMMDFGIKATAKSGTTDFKNLTLGEMKYIADEKTPDAKVTELKTQAVWKESTKMTQQARITWKDEISDEYRKHILNYYVFYLNDKGERTGLAWAGPNKTAQLSLINKASQDQKIEIVALDDLYNVAVDTQAIVKLSV